MSIANPDPKANPHKLYPQARQPIAVNDNVSGQTEYSALH